MALTYSSYLKLDELLSLQEPLSKGKAHDEMLFIIVHQAYELWFKEILHELDYLRIAMERCELAAAQLSLKRSIAIIRVFIAQMDVLETMLPLQFLAFREHLGTASGFQSAQFRELECIMGCKRLDMMAALPEQGKSKERVEHRYRSPTVWDSVLQYLAASGYAIPSAELERDVTQPAAPSSAVQRVLAEIYRDEPGLAYFCELLLDFDEGFQEWRYRHVKMVERMIGDRHGTGGSAGVEYLKRTLFKPAFPDLWAVRTELDDADRP